MKIFYYTASGNSLSVAKAFSADLFSIPSVLRGESKFFEDEQIGLVFPCYVGSVPPPVQEFLAQVELRTDYLFGILTYGKSSGGALAHLDELARKNSLEFSYLNKLMMVDSSIKYFDMVKQVENQDRKRIEKHLDTIVNDVTTGLTAVPVFGAFKRIFSRVGEFSYKRECGGYDRKFIVESSCNGCGICAEVCPVDNIKVERVPRFRHNCIRCYGCTHNCPQNAIRLKGEKSRARFRNENVKLQEIVTANNSVG